MKLTRTYHLRIYANSTKADTIRYAQNRFSLYVKHWLGRLFFSGRKYSTAGMGLLANQAKHKARGIIKAQVESAKATGNKTNVPEFTKITVPAKIELSRHSSFNHWVKVSNLWEKSKTVAVPALTHRALNTKLRNGWTLSPHCEVVTRNGKLYAEVYVNKEVDKAKPKQEMLGCDVGYKYSVSRSDGHIGHKLSNIIRKQKKKNAERQRQRHAIARTKSCVRQLLDKEARLAVVRCRRVGKSLAVESPKVVGRLGRRNLQGWSAAYFAKRCRDLGAEMGVFVWEVWPAYTSQTCNKCGYVDKRSRNGVRFVCTSCGHIDHADVNAARNIAEKGTASLAKVFGEAKRGRPTRAGNPSRFVL